MRLLEAMIVVAVAVGGCGDDDVAATRCDPTACDEADQLSDDIVVLWGGDERLLVSDDQPLVLDGSAPCNQTPEQVARFEEYAPDCVDLCARGCARYEELEANCDACGPGAAGSN